MLPSHEITLKMLPNGQTFPVQHMEMLENNNAQYIRLWYQVSVTLRSD